MEFTWPQALVALAGGNSDLAQVRKLDVHHVHFYDQIILWSETCEITTPISFTVREIHYNTPSKHDYNSLWRTYLNKEYSIIHVKACSDAHAVIARNAGEAYTDAYEVVIGGWDNTQSAILSSVNIFNI